MTDLATLDRLAPDVRYAPISATTAGDTVIVAATEGRRVKVLHYVLATDDAVDIKFKSGSTDLTGSFTLASAGDGLDPGVSLIGHFRTGHAEPLVLNLSGAAVVGGHLAYVTTG